MRIRFRQYNDYVSKFIKDFNFVTDYFFGKIILHLENPADQLILRLIHRKLLHLLFSYLLLLFSALLFYFVVVRPLVRVLRKGIRPPIATSISLRASVISYGVGISFLGFLSFIAPSIETVAQNWAKPNMPEQRIKDCNAIATQAPIPRTPYRHEDFEKLIEQRFSDTALAEFRKNSIEDRVEEASRSAEDFEQADACLTTLERAKLLTSLYKWLLISGLLFLFYAITKRFQRYLSETIFR